jgi:colanic acid/amylovoran biosynthesis glycosyltransferase
VLRQITGLLERGHHVTIFAQRSPDRTLHERIERFGLLARARLRPSVPGSPVPRVLNVLRLLAGGSPTSAAIIARTLNVRRLGRRALNLRLALATEGWHKSEDFDLVHAHFAPNGVTAVDLRAARMFDAPIVTTFHGYDINVLPGGPGAQGYDRLFTEGDTFTANSQFLAGRAEALGCPADRTTILPMGVELPPAPVRRASNEGVTRVLTVARLSEEKGLSDAIEGVAQAVAGGANLQYRIIGGGPLEADLRDQVTRSELQGIVTLAGPAPEDAVRAAYEESDLFLLPSIRASDGSEEAQGMVLQEAQAQGLPVITSDIGGIPEGVDDGESAFVVAPGDIDAIAARLVESSADPGLRERMGQHGRELVAARFDIERLNDRLVEVYEETLARAR